MDRVINVGLIGYGMSGRVFHAPIIMNVEGFNLEKLFERNLEKIQIAKNRYPEVEIVQDVRKIFEDENIDLVVVAAVNKMHFTLAKDALMAKKHVIVEKPFTITSVEADELIELSKKNNRILTCYQNRRWDSDFKTVKKVIDSGLLGNIIEYEAHFDEFRDLTEEEVLREDNGSGSGILYDLGPHLIDQAQCLFGMPYEIYADICIQRESGRTIDYFEIILSYEKIKVVLKACTLIKKTNPHFSIHGTKGSFVKYGMDVQEETLNKGITPSDLNNWGEEHVNLRGTINTIFNDLKISGRVESEYGDYREFYRNVKEAILENKKLHVLPEEARNTIRLIELAMKSYQEKKRISI